MATTRLSPSGISTIGPPYYLLDVDELVVSSEWSQAASPTVHRHRPTLPSFYSSFILICGVIFLIHQSLWTTFEPIQRVSGQFRRAPAKSAARLYDLLGTFADCVVS